MAKNQKYTVHLFVCPNPDNLHGGPEDLPLGVHVEYLMINGRRLVRIRHTETNLDRGVLTVIFTYRTEASPNEFILIDQPTDAMVQSIVNDMNSTVMSYTRLCRSCKAKGLGWHLRGAEKLPYPEGG